MIRMQKCVKLLLPEPMIRSFKVEVLGSISSIVKKAVRTIGTLIQCEKERDRSGTELFKT